MRTCQKKKKRGCHLILLVKHKLLCPIESFVYVTSRGILMLGCPALLRCNLLFVFNVVTKKKKPRFNFSSDLTNVIYGTVLFPFTSHLPNKDLKKESKLEL
jgi:hypothetical protein